MAALKPILRFVVRHPWPVITAVVLATVGFLLALPGLDINTDFESYIDHDDPAYLAMERAEERFGSSDILMIALVSPETIYDADVLTAVGEMTKRLEDLPGIDEVRTPLNTQSIEAAGDSIEVGPLAPDEKAPQSQEEIDAFRARVESNEAVLDMLVSKDGSAANLLVTYETSADAQTLTRQVTDLVDEYRGRYTFYISGMHFLSQSLSESMSTDLVKLLPIVIFVIVLVLYGSFRSLRGVWIPLLVVGVSVIWVFGLMSLVGAPVTAVSFLLPVLLLAIGIAYGIHILSHVDEHVRSDGDKRDAILRAMEEIHTPVWMTGLTTVAGFMALVTSFLPVLRSFGLAAGLGVATAMTLSILVIPALLSVLPAPKRRKVETQDGVIARGLRRAGRVVVGRRRAVLFVAVGLLCLFAAGMPFMPMDSSVSAFLGERHPAVQGMDVMEAHFSGSEQVIIEIDTGVRNGLKDPAVLAEMVALEEHLKEIGIRRTTSLTDVVRQLNRKFHGDDPAYDVIPQDRALVAQLLLLYAFQGGDLGSLAVGDFSAGEIIGFYPKADQDELNALVTSTRAYLKTEIPVGIEASMVGSTALQHRMTTQLLTSQLVSLGTSVVIAAAIVAILMGSVIAGLIAVLPLVFAIVINFGTMGFAGMTLNIATAMISSITIGIGIDYAIHFISRYRKEHESTREVADAVAQTASTSGRAILFNAVSVIGGFMVLLVSTFSAFKSFGGLISLSMAVSAISALVVVPAIFAMWSPRFLTCRARKRGGTPAGERADGCLGDATGGFNG
jgi:predicted RND superfamily exporter protein